jgi:hypothetical protein
MESHSPPGKTAARREGDPVAPPGYRLLTQKRVLGSVVRATWATPEGDVLQWTSRGQRKGGAPMRRAPAAVTPAEAPRQRPPIFGVAPRSLAWWIAVVFTVGSLFFVAGALGAVTGPTRWWPNLLYFVGSLLFTAGAGLQLGEALRAGRDVVRAPSAPRPRLRHWFLLPGRLDWNATVIQLTGTVLFNVNCFYGMYMSLTHRQEDVRVWVPSTVASVCFVSASHLAFVEAEGTWLAWRPRELEWWITTGSLLGSLGFLVSSIAGFFLGGDLSAAVTGLLGPHGETLWLEYAVDGVLLAGSLWFLVGTYLMIPEALVASRQAGAPREPARPQPSSLA